jgi:hypothetical protein
VTVLLIVVVFWLPVCLSIYRALRSAKWLAGSSVATCAFLLGTTVACGVFAPRSILLFPIGLAVAILMAVHAWSAQTTVPDAPDNHNPDPICPLSTSNGSGDEARVDFLI